MAIHQIMRRSGMEQPPRGARQTRAPLPARRGFGDALTQAANHAGIPYGPSVIASMLGSLPPLPPAASRGGSG